MEDVEQQIRDELSGSSLSIAKEESFMFDSIDCFVALSRENTTVKKVMLQWWWELRGLGQVGQVVGNLMELQTINISFFPFENKDDDGDEARMPNWKTVTRILPYLRRKVLLCVEDFDEVVEDIQGLDKAIHGYPMISEFEFAGGVAFANMGLWCSAAAL
jgi:hypothetical protein